MNQEASVGTIFGVLGIICSCVGFIVCWWLGFIGLIFGIIGLCSVHKTAGAVSLGLSIIELIVSIIVLSSLGVI